MLCRMRNTHNQVRQRLMLHDVVEDYPAEFSPVAPKAEKRAIATDADAYLLTQVEGLNYQFR